VSLKIHSNMIRIILLTIITTFNVNYLIYMKRFVISNYKNYNNKVFDKK